MDLQGHAGFDAHGILIRACRHRHGLLRDHGDGREHVGSLNYIVPVHIRVEVQPFAVELLKRRRELERELNNLVRDELFLERSPRIRPVIDDACGVPAIVAVGGAVVAGVPVMKDLYRDALKRLGSLHRRDIHGLFRGDLLERSLSHLASVAPPASHGVRKVIVCIGDDFSSHGTRGCEPCACRHGNGPEDH